MPRKPTGRSRGRPKKTSDAVRQMMQASTDSEQRADIVRASARVRTVPEAVGSLLSLTERTAEHWRKLDDVAMHFAELAVKLSPYIDKAGEALFCAEKALALKEKYEELRERVEQTANNVGIVIEYSDVTEACRQPQLTVIDGKTGAIA